MDEKTINILGDFEMSEEKNQKPRKKTHKESEYQLRDVVRMAKSEQG